MYEFEYICRFVCAFFRGGFFRFVLLFDIFLSTSAAAAAVYSAFSETFIPFNCIESEKSITISFLFAYKEEEEKME